MFNEHSLKSSHLCDCGDGDLTLAAGDESLLSVFLHVVETEGDDFEDDVHQDLLPVLFFFSFHDVLCVCIYNRCL